MAIETTNQAIKVGDQVRARKDGKYLGKVVDVVRFIVIQAGDAGQYWAAEDAIEVAPRLSPEEAWAELPYTILGQINQRMAWGAMRLLDYDQSQIRHACYKLLGGAGIKVTNDVKERVRKVIQRIADAMGVELD